MVAPSLIEPYLERGRKILDRLDEEGVCPEAALWLYNPEPDEWNLVLGMSSVDKEGSRHVLQKIDSILRESDEKPKISLVDIRTRSLQDRMIRALRETYGPRDFEEPKRLRGGPNDAYLDDAFIYRL